MSDLERRAVEALAEIVAEIDAGNLGRLTAIDGVPAWQESVGTTMAREVLASLEPGVCLAGNPTLGDLPCGDPDCVCAPGA